MLQGVCLIEAGSKCKSQTTEFLETVNSPVPCVRLMKEHHKIIFALSEGKRKKGSICLVSFSVDDLVLPFMTTTSNAKTQRLKEFSVFFGFNTPAANQEKNRNFRQAMPIVSGYVHFWRGSAVLARHVFISISRDALESVTGLIRALLYTYPNKPVYDETLLRRSADYCVKADSHVVGDRIDIWRTTNCLHKKNIYY